MNILSSNSCLIGYTGFVGATLQSQKLFNSFYNSTNIREINNHDYDLVVCSAAPAQKWIANQFPDKDKANIEMLIGYLKNIHCKKFILISTVDVFSTPIAVQENTNIDESKLNAYGFNRRLLEKFVISNFNDHLIIRLPGLVGKGLKKNILYDFLNNNNLHLIDSRGIFQFYPMVNLWNDIEIALNNNLSLVHLTAEPISVKEIALRAFNKDFENILNVPPAQYDMQTQYSKYFYSHMNYQYNKEQSLKAILNYVK